MKRAKNSDQCAESLWKTEEKQNIQKSEKIGV